MKPAQLAFTTFEIPPPTVIGVPLLAASDNPRAQIYVPKVTRTALIPRPATNTLCNSPTLTATPRPAKRANQILPVQVNTRPTTTPVKPTIDPGERSMWPAMIEKVIAIEINASGVYCATKS